MDWNAHTKAIAEAILAGPVHDLVDGRGDIFFEAEGREQTVRVDPSGGPGLVVLLDDEHEVCAELDRDPDSNRAVEQRRYRVRVLLERIP